MNLERMKEVLADEAFVKELFTLETAQEVQEALSQKGVELTVEEIEQAEDLLDRYQNGELSGKEEKAMEILKGYQNGELSEEELEEVAGGFLFGALMTFLFLTFACGVPVTHTATGGRW